MPVINRLYLAAIPIVHMDTGFTEQVLTLFPDQQFATQFSADEVDSYLSFFERRADSYLKGGNVTSYKFEKEPIVGTKFVRVLVTQHVGCIDSAFQPHSETREMDTRGAAAGHEVCKRNAGRRAMD